MKAKKLVLETGEVFEGTGFGADEEVVAELIFNTAVVGYQETLTDPSNMEYIVVMAYPVVGNYGMNDEDYESGSMTISGLVVREYNNYPSNFRCTHDLAQQMSEDKVPGITGIDTREIVRILKEKGSMRAMIADADKPIEECIEKIKLYSVPKNVVARISTKKIWHSRTASFKYTVACIDLGVKRSLIQMLKEEGCNVVVFPYDTPIEVIKQYKPSGLFIPDGPSNPYDVTFVMDTINRFKGMIPILGVGLGQEMIELAYGAKLIKQKVGHNGVNIPVRNVKTGRIEITSQNDQYALDDTTIAGTGLEITHKNVIDGIAVGIEDTENGVLAVQYNPAPTGDDEFVFKRFVKLMDKFGGKRHA